MPEPIGRRRNPNTCCGIGRMGIVCLLLTAWTTAVHSMDQTVAGALPDSLASWYKPHSKRQVWLHTMFAMRRELQAVEEYAEQGDLPRLRKWAGRLVEHYRDIPRMVPEWTDEVEPDIAAQLERSANAGDAGETAAAARRLSRTCRSCHREFRALAAARFRTPDFTQIGVTGKDGGESSYADVMTALSRTLNRIKIASEDGLWNRALTASDALGSQLTDLGESCGNCHRDPQPRERILGEATQATLDQLRTNIRKQDPKQTGRSLGSAAVQICARCHGTHRILSDLRKQLFR